MKNNKLELINKLSANACKDLFIPVKLDIELIKYQVCDVCANVPIMQYINANSELANIDTIFLIVNLKFIKLRLKRN